MKRFMNCSDVMKFINFGDRPSSGIEDDLFNNTGTDDKMISQLR